MVIGKDGALISISALNLHSDVLKNIRQYQFQQKKGGELIVRIVPKENFNGSADEKRITDAFYQKVSDNLDISIEQVDKMRLTKRGKHRLLTQYLDTKQLKNERNIK
jgi:phenylacetate-CoA ligase